MIIILSLAYIYIYAASHESNLRGNILGGMIRIFFCIIIVMTLGIVPAIIYLIFGLRAYNYFIHFILLNRFAMTRENLAKRSQLYKVAHPVRLDDLCWFPLPRLHRILVDHCEHDLCMSEIRRLAFTYPSQSKQALIASYIVHIRSASQINNLAELDKYVNSMPSGPFVSLDKILSSMHKISVLQARLNILQRPAFREPVAGEIRASVENLRYQIADLRVTFRDEFQTAALHWQSLADRQYADAKTRLKRELTPQVFRAGESVDRDREAFVPRMPIIEALEEQLTLPAGCPGLLITGRRRMGKSTLIRNLRGFIPETIKVVIVPMHPSSNADAACPCVTDPPLRFGRYRGRQRLRSPRTGII